MGKDVRRGPESGMLQHRRPEQCMEIEDVLADEMVKLGLGVLAPVAFEIQSQPLAQLGEAAHIADGSVQPDIEELAGRVGNLEAEVRSVTRDVPVGQPRIEPLGHLVGRLRLQMPGAGPVSQILLALPQLEEIMHRGLADRGGARDGGIGIDQIRGRITGAASLAGVAILVLRMATGALALDEAIGQEHFLVRIVILLDAARLDQTPGFQPLIDDAGKLSGFFRMSRIILVELNMKASEIPLMFLLHPGDQGFRRDPFLLSPQHDGCAVGIIGADIMAFMPAHLLEPHPDVGLNIFDEMAEVNGTVGVGEGAGNENFAWGHGVNGLSVWTKG